MGWLVQRMEHISGQYFIDKTGEMGKKNMDMGRTADVQEKLNRAIASMSDEWLLIEEINLLEDTFEILHDHMYRIGIPIPRECSYTEQNLQIQELIAPEYQEYRMKFCNLENLRKLLKQGDAVECEYVVVTGENTWRRDVFKVVEWSGDEPKIVNWFHMNIDRKKANELRQREAIREAYRQSEQAYLIKNMYLKRLSEEIQMPIHMIVGNAAVARTFSTKPERVTECIDGIALSAKAIYRIVRQMVNMDAFQEGTMMLEMSQTSLRDLWMNTIAIVRPSMKLRRHKLHVDSAQLFHSYIIGDVQKLQQILLNLLQNAIDYTPYGGEILLGIKDEPVDEKTGCFEFYIQDNGIGMTDEFQRIMFEPFAREYSDRIERVEGSGLGLMIVQNLVRLMDGEIFVDTQCGQGTKVTVRLRLQYGEKPQNRDSDDSYFDWKEWETSVENQKLFSGERVMVVDDNDLTASIEEQILKEQGLVVDRALNGEDALAMFEQAPVYYYDLILMDMGLPYMDGFATTMGIRRLREDGEKIPVIALTSHLFADEFHGEEYGIKERLTKPVSARKLIEAVGKYLGTRKESHEHQNERLFDKANIFQ